MRIASIISEYNPFHEGHKYHMEKTKKITAADYTIVLMSGNFTQRGTPAILDKYARCAQALAGGADLVLELPVCFAAASAEGFAFGAVSILHKLGIVDSLVFGSEAGKMDHFQKVSALLASEPALYREMLQKALKQGLSYPKARANALGEYFPDIPEDFFHSPNNILGIEYCRALNYFSSSITPVTISRKDNLYHDKDLSDTGKLSSATAIREVLTKTFSSPSLASVKKATPSTEPDFSRLLSHLPKSSLEILQKNWGHSTPIVSRDFSLLLKYKLLSVPRSSYTDYFDVSPDLADRIYNHLDAYETFDTFPDLLKTKELTRSRIERSLLHILLDIRKEDALAFRDAGYGQYARILGFRKDSVSLLHEIKKNASIPLISKLADSVKELDPLSLSMLEMDIKAAHIYESVVADKFGTPFRNEFRQKIVIL